MTTLLRADRRTCRRSAASLRLVFPAPWSNPHRTTLSRPGQLEACHVSGVTFGRHMAHCVAAVSEGNIIVASLLTTRSGARFGTVPAPGAEPVALVSACGLRHTKAVSTVAPAIDRWTEPEPR